MHAKSSARKSACTKPVAQPSSPSAKPIDLRDCRYRQRGDPSGIGRSSNGRTTDSDSVYLGSNPSLPANTASQDVSGSPVATNNPAETLGFFLLHVPRGIRTAHAMCGVICGVMAFDSSRLPHKTSSKFGKCFREPHKHWVPARGLYPTWPRNSLK